METNNDDDENGAKHKVAGPQFSGLLSPALPHLTRRHRPPCRDPRQALMVVKKLGVGRLGHEQRKRLPRVHLLRALTTVASTAQMLSFISFPKLLRGSPNHTLSNRILREKEYQPGTMEGLVALRNRPSSPVGTRGPRPREEPCSFRTRLTDGDSDIFFDSTDKLDAENIKFDDAQCIAVGRSVQMSTMASHDERTSVAKPLNARLYIVPEPVRHSFNSDDATLRAEEEAADGDGDDDMMESMNMPFWHAPKRQPKRQHLSDTKNTSHDNLPVMDDDMSIISDISLIPTYFPSDIQQQRKRLRRALLFKHLIVAKARAARQTMRQIKRSCRDAVGNVFVVDSSSSNVMGGTTTTTTRAFQHQPTRCIAVGAGF